MDLSNKQYPSPGGETIKEQHPDMTPRDSADPRQYLQPISSSSYIQSTPAHLYHPPTNHQPPYFFSQGSQGFPPHSSSFYPEPYPQFRSNPYLHSPQEVASYEEIINYGSQMLDGMVAKGGDHQKQKPNTNKGKPEKGVKNPANNKKDQGGREKQKQRPRRDSDGDASDRDEYGNLRNLLYETLQQEVTALDVLRKQIAQFAVLTRNAEKFCNMDLMNPVLAQQGLRSVVPPEFMPRAPRPAHQLRPPLIHRPIPRQMPPHLRPQQPQHKQMPRPQPPPPAHMRNIPQRPPPPYPHFQPGVPRHPVNRAFQTLREVEARLKDCEKEVANKIDLYENHVKRPNGVGPDRRGNKNDGVGQRRDKPGNFEGKDIQNMAIRTLQDIEKRLKVTERDMDAKGLQDAKRRQQEKNYAGKEDKKRPHKRDMAIQTPDNYRKGKAPHGRAAVASAPESLEELNNRLETDMLESKFAKKIILLLYSHLRKLARGALEKNKYCDEPNYKALLERNGVMFTVPTGTPDEFDELAINVELKIPMTMFECVENKGKAHKLGESLNRCKRKCCKKRHNKKHSDREGYMSEPDERRKSRQDGADCEKRRHYSAPHRRLSSEEEDLEVLEARTRRIKEYLDSSTAAGGHDPCEEEKHVKEPDLIDCLLQQDEPLPKDDCAEKKRKQEEEDKCKEDYDPTVIKECGEGQRFLSMPVDEICVETASKIGHPNDHSHKHHHHKHHHDHHKHRHHHHHHRGLDSIAVEPSEEMPSGGIDDDGKFKPDDDLQNRSERRITWPKDAYLAKHQHHGTFWPMWTESPYCREAKTLEDVPTVDRECTNGDNKDDNDWEENGRAHRRWAEMDGAQGSHFTSVSEPRNDLYTQCDGQCEQATAQEQHGCNGGYGMVGCGEEGCQQEAWHDQLCQEECQPEDLSMNSGAPYHMQLTMAGPFYPETITRVLAPNVQEECPTHSPGKTCVKGQLVKDGLQFNYY